VRRTGERIALALQKRSWVTLGSAGREFLAGVAISPGAVFLSGAKDKVVSGHGGEACAAPFNCRLSRPSLIPAKAIGPRVCEPRPMAWEETWFLKSVPGELWKQSSRLLVQIREFVWGAGSSWRIGPITWSYNIDN